MSINRRCPYFVLWIVKEHIRIKNFISRMLSLKIDLNIAIVLKKIPEIHLTNIGSTFLDYPSPYQSDKRCDDYKSC